MIISTLTLVLISTSTSAASIGVCSVICSKKLRKQYEINKMKNKIKILIDEIEDQDPNSLHNLIMECEPDPKIQYQYPDSNEVVV